MQRIRGGRSDILVWTDPAGIEDLAGFRIVRSVAGRDSVIVVGHVGYGGSKAAELMMKGDESRERLQNALNYWYVKALDMFGHAESKRSERYRFWGLKRRSNAQARKEYIAEVNPLIAKLGLQVPKVHHAKRLYH